MLRHRPRLPRLPTALAVLIALAAIEALAWIAAVPAFQGPDEPAHFGYTQNLAENGERPQFSGGSGTDSTEVGSALTFLDLRALAGSPNARPPWSEADAKAWSDVEEALPPGAKENAGGPNAVAKNPPLYYAYEALPYLALQGAPLMTRVFAMRLANALLFVGTVVFAWLLAAELFQRVWPRVLVAGLVLLQPMLAFMAAVVNPDTLQACLWTAFAWISARTLLRGPSARRLTAIGLVTVAALFTHGRGAALAPAALVALVLIAHRHRPRWRKPLLWTLALLVPLALAWLAWQATSGGVSGAYGGELNVPPEARDPLRFLSYLWQFYLPRLGFMGAWPGPDYGFRQFWIEGFLAGRFGALETIFSPTTYDLVELVVVSLALLVVVAAVARRDLLVPRWDVIVLLASIALSLLLFVHFASFRALSTQNPPSDPLIVGRYLLPLTALWALAVAFVAAAARRAGPLLAALALSAAVVLQLGALGITVARFYG